MSMLKQSRMGTININCIYTSNLFPAVLEHDPSKVCVWGCQDDVGRTGRGKLASLHLPSVSSSLDISVCGMSSL